MATTIDNMATDAEDLEEDLLIEALHQHLAYVEARLLEIGLQIQRRENASLKDDKVKKCPVKKVRKKQVLPPIHSPPVPRVKLPRASELTKIPVQPKPVLTEKEQEALHKEKLAARQTELKQLSVLEAVERLKREYRHQYIDLMERHIAEQHRQVKEKDRLWEKKIAKRKEKEQRLRLKRKPAAFRSSAVADYAFLQNLHQSNFYKIVSAELELRKKGMLTSLQDLKYFWDQMLLDINNSSPDVSHRKDRESSSLYRRHSSRHSHHHRPHSIEESPVLEGGEEDEDGSSHSWAITALPHQRALHRTHVASNPSPQDSLVFEPIKMPTFKPLNQLMSPVKQEEPCTVKHLARVEDIQRKSKNVERMFRVAKSNELIMARLMEHLDLDPALALPEPVGMSMSSVSTRPMAPSPVLPPIPAHTATEDCLAAGVGDCPTPPAEDDTMKTAPVVLPVIPPTTPPTSPSAPLTAPLTTPPLTHVCTTDHGESPQECMTMEEDRTPNTTTDQGESDTISVVGSTLLPEEAICGQREPQPVLIPLSIENVQTPDTVRVTRKTAMWSNYVLAGQ